MTCSQDGCSEIGIFRPVLNLRSSRTGSATKLRFTQLGLCETHHRIKTVNDFLSVEGFDKLVKHLREAGKTAPVRKFTQLDWERIDHDVEIGTPIKLETAAIKLEAADESLPF